MSTHIACFFVGQCRLGWIKLMTGRKAAIPCPAAEMPMLELLADPFLSASPGGAPIIARHSSVGCGASDSQLWRLRGHENPGRERACSFLRIQWFKKRRPRELRNFPGVTTCNLQLSTCNLRLRPVLKWFKLIIAVLLLPVCAGAAMALWRVVLASGRAETVWVGMLAGAACWMVIVIMAFTCSFE